MMMSMSGLNHQSLGLTLLTKWLALHIARLSRHLLVLYQARHSCFACVSAYRYLDCEYDALMASTQQSHGAVGTGSA